ncbi:MAG TPA: phenylalanine--tRNA ligase subunit beta [Dehalococcoidia bacterium]|nr:phenylalanine--tRNA ligase subunit beta [Dehalococcoidia bacterium]
MKVSVKWLRDYVPITETTSEIAHKLTMAGLEVEDVEVIGGDWKNVFVGEIIAVNPHPNADRLRLATVNLGSKQVTVVCGAPNLIVGDKIAFAEVGAELIDGHTGQKAQLKPAKIRGVISEGMICSEKELGISDNHEGILVLPHDALTGMLLADYMGDTIFDIAVTSNRPDCMSVIGVAREVAAQTNQHVSIQTPVYAEEGVAIQSLASIAIKDPDLCPRYCASLVTGVKIGPSPSWLQQRLLASGMRPINNVVDVTNYVMLEYGQPLHAFDFNKLQDHRIEVRRAQEGELFKTLDDIDRKLTKDTLVIADGKRAVAVAGIMGGQSTEVTDATKDILIESATFNAAILHRGSVALNLRTEASLRFEKGLSRELPLLALKRATELMKELTGCKVAKGIIDVYPGKEDPKQIVFSAWEVKRLLGIDLSVEEIITILTKLDFECESTGEAEEIRVTVPWWRTDVTCKADLVEETARVIGYDSIPTTMLSSSLPEPQTLPMRSFRQKVQDVMVHCGFQEIITYSLTSIEMLQKLSPKNEYEGSQPVRAAHPMSRELEYLRTSLRPGALTTLVRNQRYKEAAIQLFEIGSIFLHREKDLPKEKEMLCAVLSSVQPKLFWQGTVELVDFYTVKGVVETLLSQFGIEAAFNPGDDESLLAGKNAVVVVDGDPVGVFGEIHPRVARAFDINDTAFLIELDLEKLFSYVVDIKSYKPISRYPSMIRDIAILVDVAVPYERIRKVITASSLVNQVVLFDLYSGEQVPQGKKSLAIRIIYQSSEHTLTDIEVDDVQKEILDALSHEFNVTLRS